MGQGSLFKLISGVGMVNKENAKKGIEKQK